MAEMGDGEKSMGTLQQPMQKKKGKKKNKLNDIVYSSTGLCYVAFGGKLANTTVTAYTDENLDDALSKLSTKLSKRRDREE